MVKKLIRTSPKQCPDDVLIGIPACLFPWVPCLADHPYVYLSNDVFEVISAYCVHERQNNSSECGKLTAKLRGTVPVCFMVNDRETKRCKNMETPGDQAPGMLRVPVRCSVEWRSHHLQDLVQQGDGTDEIFSLTIQRSFSRIPPLP